jgi:hypothetical protein
MGDWKELKRVLSPDGKKRMLVRTAYGDRFRFDEDTYVTEDGLSLWEPTHISGLYDSAEAAEQAARKEIPWLRDKTTN